MTSEKVMPELWAVRNAPTPSNKLWPTTNEEKAKDFAAFYEQDVIPFVRLEYYEKEQKKREAWSNSYWFAVSIFNNIISGSAISEQDFKWLCEPLHAHGLECQVLTNFSTMLTEGSSFIATQRAFEKIGVSLEIDGLGEIDDAHDMDQDQFLAWLDQQPTTPFKENGFMPVNTWMDEDGAVWRHWIKLQTEKA